MRMENVKSGPPEEKSSSRQNWSALALQQGPIVDPLNRPVFIFQFLVPDMKADPRKEKEVHC
jgi:hypothetical protein